MKSLLEDLQDDLTADALAKPAAPRPKNEWHEPVSWTFTGYIARCRVVICPSCGQEDWLSDGVYSEEKGTNGTRKLVAAPQFPTGEKGARMELTRVEGNICWRCLSESFGFENLVEAPEVVTNIAGAGFTTPKGKVSLSFTRKMGRGED